MKNLLFVFIGGGAGSILRYLINISMAGSRISAMPFATLTANCASSFILGAVISVTAERSAFSEPLKLMLTAGFCGGFSTFSAFTADNLQLIKNGNYTVLLLNISLNVILCVIFMITGMLAGKNIS